MCFNISVIYMECKNGRVINGGVSEGKYTKCLHLNHVKHGSNMDTTLLPSDIYPRNFDVR